MATCPSGYYYWSASKSKAYYAGETLPTISDGDAMVPLNSRTHLRYEYSKNLNIWGRYQIGDGWAVGTAYDPSTGPMTITTASIYNSFNGKNVIAVTLNGKFFNSIKTLNIPTNIKFFDMADSSSDYSKNLETISGSFPSTLEYAWFSNARKLKSVPDLTNTKIKDCSGLFLGCTSLVKAPKLPSTATNCDFTFYKCASLTTGADIPSSVTSADSMYSQCKSLTTIPKNNSTIIKYYKDMFNGCSSLSDASDFNIPLTSSGTINTSYMFFNCENLIYPPPSIPKNIQSAAYMFYNCKKLKTLPLFNKNSHMGKIDFSYMFYGCYSLEAHTLLLSGYNLDVTGMFMNAKLLECVINLDMLYVPGGYQNMLIGTSTIITIGLDEIKFPQTNVHKGNIEGNNYVVYRSNLDGTPNDDGQYLFLSVDFTSPVISESKLYVPKVYFNNDQQEPVKDWILVVDDEEIIIENSTSISEERIYASPIIDSGIFKTVFQFPSGYEEDIVTFDIYIASSTDNVAINYDSSGEIIYDTYYWNGIKGQSVFTGATFIFDATADGKSFKIGGPIREESEKGFIVGNVNDLEDEKMPSTFNGPVNINNKLSIFGDGDNVNLFIDENSESGIDKSICDSLTSLDWKNEVIS